MRPLEARQWSLLYQTDHVALREACRAEWTRRAGTGLDLSQNVVMDPSDPTLPQALQALDAHWMTISSSGVEIELGGQWCHYGFEAIFADPTADRARVSELWKDVFPSKQLADGLWYYAENGVVEPR
jgi:hypothetical protein